MPTRPGPRLGGYLVELVTTFFLTLTVLAAAAQDLLLGALAIGAVVSLVMWCGGHANPVVSLAAVLARRMAATELLPCWAAQFVGALVAAALARWLVTAPAVGPLQDTGLATLFAVELLFAFALCFVAFRRHEWSAGSAGLTVVAAAALLDPVAAAAFNPAAAFAQVVAGVTDWATIWVYLVACPLGAALAGLAVGQSSSRPG